LTSITIRYFDNQLVVGLSYSLIFSRAKIQLEVGASLQHLSYDESWSAGSGLRIVEKDVALCSP
jgi:hypothetical protein